MRRRPVLVEVVIAEADIDRKMETVGVGAALIALAELAELGPLARLLNLAATIVGHVAAQNHAGGRSNPLRRRPSARSARRRSFPARPDPAVH